MIKIKEFIDDFCIKLLNIKNFYIQNKHLLLIRIITIIIFCILLVPDTHNFIVEKFVENNIGIINESFVSSKLKDEFIAEWNSKNIRSSGYISDVFVNGNNFSFEIKENTSILNDGSNVLTQKNANSIVISYIKELTKESTSLSFAILFPAIFDISSFLFKDKKSLASKKRICSQEIFIVFISLFASIFSFILILYFYVKKWDEATTKIPQILLFITFVGFMIKILLKNDKEIKCAKNKKIQNFNQCIEWMLTHKTKTAILTALLFAVPLIIVHILFKWNSRITWIQAEWSAGDILSYIAGFEAFIGTTFLSFLALWQNQKHKQENDAKDRQLIEIENEKMRLSNMPQFLIQTCDFTKAIDSNITLDSKYQGYVPLVHTKTHGFFIQDTEFGWAPANKIPVIEQEKLSGFISLINCGNNTAHQVKLTMKIGEKTYGDEKVYSVQKDDEIFLYLSINPKTNLTDDLILQLRFFDCFQNVYEQSFLIKDIDTAMLVLSYADIKIVKRNTSMNFQIDKQIN